jgi:hypothetical protein
MTKRKPELVTSDRLLPSAEALPVPGKCLFCGRPTDDALGPVTKDYFGWWMHFACRVQLAKQTNRWS